MIYTDNAGNHWVLANPSSQSTSTVFWHWGEVSHFKNTYNFKGK